MFGHPAFLGGLTQAPSPTPLRLIL